MLTRYLNFSSLTICLFLVFCGISVAEEIDRDYLASLPPDFTTTLGFQVVNLSDWEDDSLSYEVDRRWEEFSRCMSNFFSEFVRHPQRAKIVVLDVDRWKCPYHDWCGGELYHGAIFVGENMLFLEHEWLHWVYNLDEDNVQKFKGVCGVK